MSTKWSRRLLQIAATIDPDAKLSAAGSGHIRILIQGPRGKRMVIASSTPSDRRTELNATAQLRRAGREVGALACA